MFTVAITCALHCEAAPIIEACGLKKVVDFRGPPLFRSDQIALIESGIGKVRSAIATTRLLDLLMQEAPSSESTQVGAINFGCAGASQPGFETGALLLANKVSDAATGRNFFPDLLLRSGISEAQVETHDRPVNLGDSALTSEPPRLFDMEASGFFEAAQMRLAPSQLAVLKLVSDQAQGERLSTELVARLVSARLDQILAFVAKFKSCLEPDSKEFSEEERELLSVLTLKLKLSSTQSSNLTSVVRNRRAAGKLELPSLLQTFSQRKASDKRERNQILAELLGKLRANN